MRDIIMFYGCLQHGITVSKSALYPGTFFTPENYECYNYYGLFGDPYVKSYIFNDGPQ